MEAHRTEKKRPVDVLLLGAYGLAGKEVLSGLVRYGMRVAAGGRSSEKLSGAVAELRKEHPNARVEQCTVDVTDRNAVGRELKRAHIVIHCAGPFLQTGSEIARAALESGTHYLDIASEQEHHRRLSALSADARKHGVVIGTGFGLYPGISGTVLRGMLEEIKNPVGAETYLATRETPSGGGAAQLMSAVLEMAAPLFEVRRGYTARYEPSQTRRITMPDPFRLTEILLWPQLELTVLRQLFSLQEARSGVSLGGEKAPSRTLVRLVRLLRPDLFGWSYRLFDRIAKRRAARSSSAPADGSGASASEADVAAAVLCRAWNGARNVERTLRVNDTEVATALLPVLAARSLIGEGGTVPSSPPAGTVVPLEWLGPADAERLLYRSGVELSTLITGPEVDGSLETRYHV